MQCMVYHVHEGNKRNWQFTLYRVCKHCCEDIQLPLQHQHPQWPQCTTFVDKMLLICWPQQELKLLPPTKQGYKAHILIKVMNELYESTNENSGLLRTDQLQVWKKLEQNCTSSLLYREEWRGHICHLGTPNSKLQNRFFGVFWFDWLKNPY